MEHEIQVRWERDPNCWATWCIAEAPSAAYRIMVNDTILVQSNDPDGIKAMYEESARKHLREELSRQHPVIE